LQKTSDARGEADRGELRGGALWAESPQELWAGEAVAFDAAVRPPAEGRGRADRSAESIGATAPEVRLSTVACVAAAGGLDRQPQANRAALPGGGAVASVALTQAPGSRAAGSDA